MNSATSLAAKSNFAVDLNRWELARPGHSLDPPRGQAKHERQTGRGQQVDEHGFASRECARLGKEGLYPLVILPLWPQCKIALKPWAGCGLRRKAAQIASLNFSRIGSARAR